MTNTGEEATIYGIKAYRTAWLRRLEPYWPIAVFIGPTGAGKSSLLNLAIGWPALWGRSGAHTTRCPAIITNHNMRILSCGNENTGVEYVCEPRGMTRSEMLTFHNIVSRLNFSSVYHTNGGLRDKFWKPFEEQFTDWHQTGITGDVYVKVSTPLPGVPGGAAIIDVPGFDGVGSTDASDSVHYRLESELAAATDFWSETADVAVFVLELEGLNRNGEMSRLLKRIRQNKPTAIFFNKLDRLNLYQYGLKGNTTEETKKAWMRYKERRFVSQI